MSNDGQSFDDFLSTEHMQGISALKPFAFRENTDAKGTLSWLQDNFNAKEASAQSRLITYRRYTAMYKGIHWRHFDAKDTHRDSEYVTRKPRMVNNFVWEMTEAKVAQMARLKSSIAVIPRHDEQSDVNNSKACKSLLDARAEEIDMVHLQNKLDRIKFTLGTSFNYIYWDKEAGPLHPAYEQAKEMGLSESKIRKKLGLKKGQSVHIGDVGCKPIGPDRIFPQLNKDRWEDVEDMDLIEWADLDELKAEYPSKGNDIQLNERNLYDFNTTELTKPENLVMVRTYFHKPTRWLPEGAMIKYCDDVILEWKEFPYEHGKLPMITDTDIEVYGELWGRSFIGNIEQMQRYYNNLMSADARNQGIAGAPKWVMPKGSANISSLNNELTIVEFSGPVAPKLVAHNPTNPQTYQVQDRLESQITKKSMVYDISRGEVPAGVTANSALRFLDEQESQMTAAGEQKRKRRVVDTYKMMVQLMAQYYKEGDGRMVRTLGPKNEYMIKSFKKANFRRVYDVKIMNSSSLPDTKTGKISAIIDLNAATQMDPIFRKEEVIQILDLGLDNTFKERATASVDQAGEILEMIMNGEPVPEPQKFDNLLVHYNLFTKFMESIQFKMKTDQQTQQIIMERVMVYEGLMWEKSMKNPKFSMELQQLSMYPIFFEAPIPAPPTPEEALVAEDAAAPSGGGSKPAEVERPQPSEEE